MSEETGRVLFSPYERQLLLRLVDKHKDVIASRDPNKITWRKKNEAFEDIERQFNSSPGVVPRTARQLRQCFLNMKKKTSRQVRRGGFVISKPRAGVQLELESITPTCEVSPSSESNCSFVEIKQEPKDDDEANMQIACIPSVVYVTSAIPVVPVAEPSVSTPTLQPKPQSAIPNQISTAVTPASSSPPVPPAPAVLPAPVVLPAPPVPPTPPPPPVPPPPPSRPAPAPSERKGSVKAAKSIIEENVKMKLERLKNVREEKEHLLRMRLLESQIAVQERILELLRTNPSSLNLVLSGNGTE